MIQETQTSEQSTPHQQPVSAPNANDSAELFFKIVKIDGSESAEASPIGHAVQMAIEGATDSPIPVHCSTGMGKIDRVILNDPDCRDEGISAVRHAVEEAQNEVCLQYYIFDPRSPAGSTLLQAIAARQREIPSLKVFLTVNSLIGAPTDLLNVSAELGASLSLTYHPGSWNRGSLHSKCAIIDGSRAFIGGTNVDNPREADCMLELSGSIVEHLLLEFDDAFSAGKIAFPKEMCPAISLMASHAANPYSAESALDQYPIQLLAKRSNHSLAPCSTAPANGALLSAIDAASRSIKIMSPNFNYLGVWQHLAEAAKRGISVQLIVPQRYSSTLSLTGILRMVC